MILFGFVHLEAVADADQVSQRAFQLADALSLTAIGSILLVGRAAYAVAARSRAPAQKWFMPSVSHPCGKKSGNASISAHASASV